MFLAALLVEMVFLSHVDHSPSLSLSRAPVYIRYDDRLLDHSRNASSAVRRAQRARTPAASRAVAIFIDNNTIPTGEASETDKVDRNRLRTGRISREKMHPTKLRVPRSLVKYSSLEHRAEYRPRHLGRYLIWDLSCDGPKTRLVVTKARGGVSPVTRARRRKRQLQRRHTEKVLHTHYLAMRTGGRVCGCIRTGV